MNQENGNIMKNLVQIINSKKKTVYYGYGKALRYTFDISSFNECYIYGKNICEYTKSYKYYVTPDGKFASEFYTFFEKEIFDIPREQVAKMFVKAIGV